MTQSTFLPNHRLVLKNDNDFNPEIEPYDTVYSIYHQVYGEEHKLPNRDGDTKQFTLEIVDTISSFNYHDEEIYNNLNCEVWQHYFNKDDGFYRIHKGNVSGQKIDGRWIIDFSVYYGGKNGDKYRMIKNARYK